MDADSAKTLKIKVLHVRRRRFKYYLQLMVLIETIGIFAVATVGRPAAGLHVGGAIRGRAEHAQERFRMHGPSANLDVIWLLKYTVAISPKFLKLQKKILKVGASVNCVFYFRFQVSGSSLFLSDWPDCKYYS